MSIRRSLAVLAASAALAGSAACSGGGSGGNPLASDPNGPAAPAPRDTSAMAPPTPPVN